MSASLVGSEMCIRDSNHDCPWPRSLAKDNLRQHLPELSPIGSLVHRCKPVSYTHLTLPTICSV
eukprot:5499856-Alexandrium_andersonii.AAC.1